MSKIPDIKDIKIDKVVKAGKDALNQLEKSGQEQKVVKIVSEKTKISQSTINSALKQAKKINIKTGDDDEKK